MPRGNLIQIRRDTAANWSSVNPVLASGEMGWDSTNAVLKIGNGTTAWNSLSAANAGGSDFTTVSLSSDVSVVMGGSPALADITGLSFPVVSGVYYFKALLTWRTGNTNTGAGFAVNGPTLNYLSMQSEWALTATTTTRNANVTAYNTPSTASATSGNASGNLAILEGYVSVSASGTFTLRGISEIGLSTLTVHSGSFIQYKKVA